MKQFFIFFLLFSLAVSAQNQPQPKNVLFIMVDDLRPELSLYGQNQIISPNIDALGASGPQLAQLLFEYLALLRSDSVHGDFPRKLCRAIKAPVLAIDFAKVAKYTSISF